MAPPSPSGRLPLPSSVPYTAPRRTMYGGSQSARHTQYSTLGDALGSGGARQPQYSSDYPPPSSAPAGPVPQHPHVTSDARNYYATPGLPSYEYPQYQSSPYEAPAQYGHPSLPPMRTASPASHTSLDHPAAPHYNPSAGPYAPSYPHPQYAPIPGGSSQQWPEDEWGQPPQDPVQPVFVAPGRGDLASPPTDPRTYVTPQYSSTPASTRPEERGAYLSEVSPSSKGKARERNPAPSSQSVPPSAFNPSPASYSELMNTYGQLLSECELLTRQTVPGRPASLDDIERMLRSATQGLQLLQPAASLAMAQTRRNPSEDSSLSADMEIQSPEMPAERQEETGPASDGQKCLGCGATSTPEWRRGPLGPRTLCNACGLVYAKMIKKRGQDTRPNSVMAPNQSQLHSAPVPTIFEEAPSFNSPNNGDSDDELSYGSQDPI
ncbi:hypothetical protein M0805_001087 [Coniferiporia weirii]|nr:hypothetical protein M0805_001087 [Coniferiporia weirii]